MASVRFGATWGQFRRIFGEGTATGLGDADLLGRFIRNRDEAAFAALVARHGPMVLATARGVLKNGHDAEDAFQATFLVLARKAGTVRVEGSLGPWLYRVARRVAVQANAEATRRQTRERSKSLADSHGAGPRSTWDDLIPLLHEEIARLPAKYRTPIVLCDLGALTRDEAAGQLGWPPGTVAGRLARGRKLLHDRMTRRGAAPSLAGLASFPPNPIVSPAWIDATTRAATLGTTGPTSISAARWSLEVLRAMTLTKLKTTAAAFLVLTAGTVAGLIYQGRAAGQAPAATVASQPVEPPLTVAPTPVPAGAPTETYELRGRVVDPDNKPVAGARVAWFGRGFTGYVVPAASTTSDPAGRFQITATRAIGPRAATMVDGRKVFLMPEEDPFGLVATAEGFALGLFENDPTTPVATVRLAKEDAPVVGRVVDIQGRPVVGAWVRPLALMTPNDADRDLSPWLAALRDARDYNGKVLAANHLVDRLQDRRGVLATGLTTVPSGPDGVVRVTGIGRERALLASVEGPGIESRVVMIATRPMAKLQIEAFPAAGRAMYSNPDEDGIIVGTTFDHVAGPGRAVAGTVKDRDSGAGLASVVVRSLRKTLFEREPGQIQTVSDAAGQFRLEGLPDGADIPVEIVPPADSPYPGATRPVKVGSAALDISLRRGVWVTGRIIEARTGQPPKSGAIRVDYYPLVGNPNLPARPTRPTGQTRWVQAGQPYRVLAYPGRGLVAVVAGFNEYVRGFGAEGIAEFDERMEAFPTYPTYLMPANANSIVAVDPPVGALAVTADIRLEFGRTRTGRVLDPKAIH